MGVSGCWRMPLSLSNTSPTNKCPLNTVRWFSGKAGQAMVKPWPGPCSASSSASVTGPMLPWGVESNVEQYLK